MSEPITPFGVNVNTESGGSGVFGQHRNVLSMGMILHQSRSQIVELGPLIKQRRQAKGLSQMELATMVGTKQQTIDKIEKGTTKNSSLLPTILTNLNMDLGVLVRSPNRRGQPPISAGETGVSPAKLVGVAGLPIHAVTAGGKGALIVTTDPIEYRRHPLENVEGGYGIIVVEDSMVPEFEPGDIALVHPHLPPAVGATCVFYARAEDGTVEAVIKRLRRVTADSWHVRQHSPQDGDKQDFVLKRAEWQTCHVTVGRYRK